MSIPRKDLSTRLAYLAGIIDGEGSFSCYKLKYKSNKLYLGKRRQYGGISKHLMISNTNKKMIELCASTMSEIIGKQVRWGRENRLTVTEKEVWFLWITGGKQLRILLPRIIPYLECKKEQANIMLKLLQRKPFSRVTEEEEQLVLKLRSLNDKARRKNP